MARQWGTAANAVLIVSMMLASRVHALVPVWRLETELHPHVEQDGAQFGASLAIGGDELAIGAPFRNAGGVDASGAVEIWRHDGVFQFAQMAMLEDPAANAYFGFAVAIDADHLYVGAPRYASDAGDLPYSGLLNYLDHFAEGDAWTSVGGIGGARGDRTGWSIAYDHGLLALGIPGPCESCGAGSSRAGKVGIAFDADDPAAMATLYPPDGAEGDRFGYSVAVHRSTDPLQPDLAVVGAPFHDSGAAVSGAAYVFANSSHVASGWMLAAELAAVDPAAQEMFGLSVAVGPGRVFIGAPGRDVPGATPAIVDAGSVFAFAPDGTGGWQLDQEVFMSNPAAHDRLGVATAYDAEHGWLVAGAPDRIKTVFGGTGQTGAVAVFRDVACGPGGPCWSETAELYSLDLLSIGQYAGASLAVADGRVYVGAPLYDANPNNGVHDSGRVLVFLQDEIFTDGFDGFE